MQAIAQLQRQRPKLHALIVGHDGVAYGDKRSDGRGWGEWAKAELPLDPDRTHWLGILQDAEYQQVLACSTVHLYLTVPFVLSWSLLEAMAAGCASLPVPLLLSRRCWKMESLPCWWTFSTPRSRWRHSIACLMIQLCVKLLATQLRKGARVYIIIWFVWHGPMSSVWSSAPRCSLASGHIDEADACT